MAKPTASHASLVALVPRGMRVKLIVGFLLMAVAPLFILVAVAIWFPVAADEMWQVIRLLCTAAGLSLGASIYLALQVMMPLLRFSHAMKRLAAGDDVPDLPAGRSHQLGELAVSLAQMRERLRASPLAIYDGVTGAHTEWYLRQQLAEELKRAVMYQRPCALAMFAVPQYEAYRQRCGPGEADRVLKETVGLIQQSVTEIDRVGRLRGNAVVVLLPERNKRHALELTRTICERVCAHFAGASGPAGRLLLVGEVAENPLDGVTAEELLQKASERLARAKQVAVAPPATGSPRNDDQGAA